MIKALIADDEERDRHIVRLLLERRYPDMFRILEAENGIETIEMLKEEEPELVLLDINMPGANGFEVLRSARRIPYVVILTAYNTFEYTREALRLGVRDYLLKPPLRAEFYGAVDHFLEDREQSRERGVSSQYREVFTRDLAQQLFFLGNARKISGLLDVLEIRSSEGVCCILRCADEGQETGPLLDAAEEYFEDSGAEYAATFCPDGIAVVRFCGPGGEQDALVSLNALANSLESDFCIKLETRFGLPARVPDDFPRAFSELLSTDPGEEEYGAKEQEAFERAVRKGNFEKAMQVIDPLIRQYGERNGRELVKYRLMSALNHCAAQEDAARKAEISYYVVSQVSAAGTAGALRETAAQLVRLMLSAPGEEKDPQTDAVTWICEKVREDCSRKWSIEVFAEMLHLSPYHLSHLFKDRAGCCFTDYLTKERIGRAVDLMKTTDMSLTRISDSVGYLDPNYFSRVFKKVKGIGPRDYSRRLRREEGKEEEGQGEEGKQE